jgi:hypothetical protein
MRTPGKGSERAGAGGADRADEDKLRKLMALSRRFSTPSFGSVVSLGGGEACSLPLSRAPRGFSAAEGDDATSDTAGAAVGAVSSCTDLRLEGGEGFEAGDDTDTTGVPAASRRTDFRFSLRSAFTTAGSSAAAVSRGLCFLSFLSALSFFSFLSVVFSFFCFLDFLPAALSAPGWSTEDCFRASSLSIAVQ